MARGDVVKTLPAAEVEQMQREGKRVVVLVRRRSTDPARNTCVVRIADGP